MADVFADRDYAGGRQMDEARRRLWILIGSPHLDWLLLTKRPAGMHRMLPRKLAALLNVWPGVTVERRTTSGGPRSSRPPRYCLRGFASARRQTPLTWSAPQRAVPPAPLPGVDHLTVVPVKNSIYFVPAELTFPPPSLIR
jgi:hypothetical protein